MARWLHPGRARRLRHPAALLNSVAIAQHIHRNVVRHAAVRNFPPVMGEQELRKDKDPTNSKQLFRMDNFDELIRCDEKTARLVQGEESPMVATLVMGWLQRGLGFVEKSLKNMILSVLAIGLLRVACEQLGVVRAHLRVHQR